MVNVEIHATSHVGRVRRGNEDNYLLLNISKSKAWTSAQESGEFVIESQQFDVDDNGIVLAVSDGMGGALAGEVASKMAVETVSEKLLTPDEDDSTLTPESYEHYLVSSLYSATLQANYLIHQQGRSDPQFQGMGATFTAIGITPKAVDIIQVGDSRAYLVRAGKIYQVTKDQSLVQQLIDAQQISPEEAETHTLKNVILQALGAQNEIYPVAARIQQHRDDVFLLCSDGLSKAISEQQLADLLSGDGESSAERLVMAALAAHATDNITAVTIEFAAEGLTPSEAGKAGALLASDGADTVQPNPQPT